MAEEASVWSPREAMASIAEVTRRDDALKARTEGLTWVIWGMGNAGAALTYVALSPDLSIEWWMPPLAALWILASVIVSAGLWRSAALPFRPGFTLKRGLVFFLAWPLLLSLLASGFMSVFGWGLVAQAKLLATGALLLAFAGMDPLRFTATGRATAAGLGVVAIAAAAVGLWLGLTGAPATLVVGGVLGVSWTAGGALALFRG
jgi:hypothetical protein